MCYILEIEWYLRLYGPYRLKRNIWNLNVLMFESNIDAMEAYGGTQHNLGRIRKGFKSNFYFESWSKRKYYVAKGIGCGRKKRNAQV